MAEVTLYDARTGELVEGDAATAPEPTVAAEDLSKVVLAVDPSAGRAFAQFVVDPGERQVVADLVPGEDDTLQDLYWAVTDRLEGSVLSLTPAADVPDHLAVIHDLESTDAYVPDPEIGAHLVATGERLEVAVPDAATATEVVAFFRGRAPWKVIAVAAPGAGVSKADADVVVTVDERYDEVTWLDRAEHWVDENALPDNIDIESDESAGAAGEADAAGDAGAEDAAVLWLFEGDTGEPVGGGEGTPPERAVEAARRRYAEGQVLLVAPDHGVVMARLRATDGSDTGLFAQYEHPGPTGDLLASFAQGVSARAADLGTTFGVDLGDAVVDADRLVATPSRPDPLRDADLAYLSRSDDPLDFAAPDAATALGLALYLRATLEGDHSLAVSAEGRTDSLAAVDVVVAVDQDCDGVEPRGETVTRLADGRLREALTEVGGAVRTVADRVGEVTGTVEAHQRVFAAAMASDALAERGLTVAPVDDDPLARRRRQARYLLLYGVVLVGTVAGILAGQFAPLAGLLAASYALAGGVEVPGTAVLLVCLVALVVGAYWLFGYPLGPLEAARALARNVRKQVTGGPGSGTVPASIADAAAPVESALDELEAGYERLADVEGSVAGDAADFGAFLEANLLTGEGLPAVTVVDREERRQQLRVGVAKGAAVGAVLGVVVVGGVWGLAAVAASDPGLVFDGLVGVVGLALLASLAKPVLAKYRDL